MKKKKILLLSIIFVMMSFMFGFKHNQSSLNITMISDIYWKNPKCNITDEYLLDNIEQYIIQNTKIKVKKKLKKDNNVDRFVFKYNDKNYTVFYDTLYDKAQIRCQGTYYKCTDEFPRFLNAIIDYQKFIDTNIDENVKSLLSKYKFDISFRYKDSKKYTLPNFKNVTSDNWRGMYFKTVNELSKDIGLDMSKYKGKKITVENYRIMESIKKLYPYMDCNVHIYKYNDKIIGAYISTYGGNNISLKQHTFKNLKSKKFNEKNAEKLYHKWFVKNTKLSKMAKRYKKLSAKNVVRKYYKAENNHWGKTKMALETPYNIYRMTEIDCMTGKLINTCNVDLDNIKKMKILKLKEMKNSRRKNKRIFAVDYYEIVKDIDLMGNFQQGKNYTECYLIYIKGYGWKIQSFGVG